MLKEKILLAHLVTYNSTFLLDLTGVHFLNIFPSAATIFSLVKKLSTEPLLQVQEDEAVFTCKLRLYESRQEIRNQKNLNYLLCFS